MATEEKLTEILTAIGDDIRGFIGASIVDTDSGMTLATVSKQGDFDLSAASAYNSEMVKLKMKTIESLNLSAVLEDMLLTLTDQLHLIKLISPNTFMYLAAERSSTNLAIIRSVVQRELGALAA